MLSCRHGYRCIAVLCITLLTACATPYQADLLRDSPPDIPPVIELSSVPFYPQRDYQCGPAALATVINHFQVQTTPEELLPLVYIPELKGSLQVEMLAATSQFGLLAIQQDGSLEAILREIASGNPVLVMQNLGLEAYPFWHYAVVIGYDLQSEHIILRSGEIKRLVRPFSVFERTWQRANFWSVVVVSPEIMPITASEDKFISAVVALESSGLKQAVLLAYQNGLKRWAQSFVMQMGLGNTHYALQDYRLAEQAFRAAIDINPVRAEAWNNLAYALLKQGKKAQAIEAVEQAVSLQPEGKQYQASRKEISSHP